jgi:hypothetical protein
MNRALIPMRSTVDRPLRRLTFALKFSWLPRLTRVVKLVAAFIKRSEEDDVVSWYEGHSWCDSSERSMNYDIMTSRRLRL